MTTNAEKKAERYEGLDTTRRYPFTNNIMFSLVMRDAKLCQGLLQLIFPDREIEDVRLHPAYASTEVAILTALRSKRIQLDVRFCDSKAWYAIEMQVADEHNIPKRTRYYHSAADVSTLNAGDDYNLLKPSYVIFLCCFDFFQQDRAIYRFSMREDEISLPLGDESYTILLNSKVSQAVPIPQPLREFYAYMNEGVIAEGNQLLQEIAESVEHWNDEERRHEIMTLEEQMKIDASRNLEKGIEIGREEGAAEERKHSEQEKRASAKQLKDSGVELQIIAGSLGLSEEEVKAL